MLFNNSKRFWTRTMNPEKQKKSENTGEENRKVYHNRETKKISSQNTNIEIESLKMKECNTCPRLGEIYRHFDQKLYQIVSLAVHSETGEELVIYQALFGDFKTYAISLEKFQSEVDRERYPNTEQKYCFQLCSLSDAPDHSKKDMPGVQDKEQNVNEGKEYDETVIQEKPWEEWNKNSSKELGLMDFLEAQSCREKLNILNGLEKNIDEHMANSMAVSLDLVITEESLEERIDGIRDYLRARIRFEGNRMR